jgi:predicted dehydrogenase
MRAIVIGLGRVGFSLSKEKTRGFASSHFGAYCMHEEIDHVIAVDRDQRRLAECAEWFNKLETAIKPDKDVTFVSDYAQAVSEWNPDIASVCVPTPFHYEVMRNICHQKGPGVICLEKPIAPSLGQAYEISKLAGGIFKDSKKPKIAINFPRRWDERYQLIKRQIDSGQIGKPLVMIGLHPGPLLRTGIHMLDLFNWYLGEPDLVTGSTEQKETWMNEEFPGTNDWPGSGVIRYGGNSYAILANMGLTIPSLVLFELYIYASKGAIKVEDNGRNVRFQQIQQSEHYAGLKELITEREMGPRINGEYDPLITFGAKTVDDLVRCSYDPDHMPKCTIEDGIRAQRLVHLIRQSKLTRQSITILHPKDADLNEIIRSH